ncbi:MAG: InlB B-repeat-containing protein [Nitrososphaerales archaeon]
MVLLGGSSVSFASPDFIPCNYTYHITYYDSPNGGTINGYSNGQTQTIQRNNIPCGNSGYSGSATASPSAGYGFSSWASSSAISLSSKSANPTSFSMGPGSGSITANYVPLPDILGVLSYSCSGCGSSNKPSPSSEATSSSSASGFSQSKYCGVEGGVSDPYCIWVATGRYDGSNYAHLLLIDNTSTTTDGSPYRYPNGNTTVQMTLQFVSSTSVAITGMSVVFASAKGNSINIGNAFEETYTDQLGAALVDMQHNMFEEGGFLLNTNQNLLGENYRTMSYAVSDLSSVLAAITQTQNYDYFTIPHLYAAAVNWKSFACPIGYVGIAAAGIGLIASVVITGGGDLPAQPLAWGLLGEGASALSLYLACS